MTLSQRETQHLMVLNALERGELAVADAATLLGRSVRQTQRLRAAYRERGAAALVHGNRGRSSPRRVADATRTRLIHLARTTYARVNFQHLSELLAEREGLVLSRPTIHRILTQEGIPSPRTRRRTKHRRRRDRLPRAGMLVQMDGSQHDWLEGRGPTLVLLHAVDDATGTALGAVFRLREDAQGYLLLLRQIAATHGLPLAVYTDRHSIFEPTTRAPTLEEQLTGRLEPTQVGRALQDAGIQWIPAASPQAKGRVERVGGTFQDRLVSELRLAGIREEHDANAFLPGFLARYNARFTQPPAEPESAYRPWPREHDPNSVFCFKYVRTVGNDNTVTLGPHHVQLLPGPGGRSYAKARVEVHERLDGTLAVFYQGHHLAARALTSAPPGPIPARGHDRVQRPRPGGILMPPPSRKTRPGASGEAAARTKRAEGSKQPWKPGPAHPWRRTFKEAQRRKALKEAGVSFSLNR